MAKLGFAFGVLMCVMVLLEKGNGTEFTVGGAKGWSLSVAQSYNQWAEANRFQIGDSLVFKYAADQDSVLQVTQDDYNNCNIQSPIRQYSNGHTVFQFDKSGPYHFISGNKDNCLKKDKLVVVVLADRSNSSTNQTLPPPTSAPSPSPSPSNSTEITPSPAPANDQTGMASPPLSGSTEINPSPPPAEETNPSPPPAEETNPSPPPAEETNPSPAPAGEASPSPTPGTVEINPAPPVSGAPPSVWFSIIPSIIGSIGAFVAAAILAF